MATANNGLLGNRAQAICLQPDGAVVVGGYTHIDNFNRRFLLARFSPDGVVDSTFGTAGTVMTAFGSLSAQINSLSWTPTGKILALGVGTAFDRALMAQYDANGVLDPGFGNAGTYVSSTYAVAKITSHVVLSDRRILTAGQGTIQGDGYFSQYFGVDRYSPVAVPDPTFGNNGHVLTTDGNDIVQVFVQRDGRVVAVGQHLGTSDDEIILARYLSSTKVFTPLSITSRSSTALTLEWSAPYIDNWAGIADTYDFRISNVPLTDVTWVSATPIGSVPAPLAPGTTQTMTVSGLSPATRYYFAYRWADAVAGTGPRSHQIGGTTLAGGGDTTPPQRGERSNCDGNDSIWRHADMESARRRCCHRDRHRLRHPVRNGGHRCCVMGHCIPDDG